MHAQTHTRVEVKLCYFWNSHAAGKEFGFMQKCYFNKWQQLKDRNYMITILQHIKDCQIMDKKKTVAAMTYKTNNI